MIFGRAIPFSGNVADIVDNIKIIINNAIDGTVVPLFVDYTNQRVLIGETAASTTNPGKLEVNGDIKIVGGSNGLVVPDVGGTSHHCRIGALFDATTGNWILTTTDVD